MSEITDGFNAAGNIISSLGQLGTGIYNSIYNTKVSERNYKFQKDVFNYQKQLQREIFQREDNAIRRRAADIAAAGGNPATAWETGSGAGAGQSIPVSAPQQEQVDYNALMGSSLAGIPGAIQQFQQFQLTSAQIKRMEADTSLVNAEVITESIRQKQLELQSAKTIEEKNKIKAEIESLNYTLDYSINHNLRPNDNNNTIYNSAKDMLNEVISVIPDRFDSMDSKTLLGVAADIGLTVLPAFAGLKFASLGKKALASALKFLKKQNGINNLQDFYGTFYRLTGRAPNKHEIELFKNGVTQKIDNRPSKSYYYRKYNK